MASLGEAANAHVCRMDRAAAKADPCNETVVVLDFIVGAGASAAGVKGARNAVIRAGAAVSEDGMAARAGGAANVKSAWVAVVAGLG